MLIKYFSYFVSNVSTGENVRFDLRDFFSAYDRYPSNEFKNQFRDGDENLFLIKSQDHTYFFVNTRDSRLLKKIKTSDLSVSEIQDMLDSDERVGYSSYVHFEEDFLGFASTFYAPKFDSFVKFVDQLFVSIGLDNFRLVIRQVSSKVTKEEVLDLPIMGKTIIQFPHESSRFEHVMGFFGHAGSDSDYIDSIEVIIKPKLRQNVRGYVAPILAGLPSDDAARVIVKAKSEMSSSLVDYYISQSSQVSDYINPKSLSVSIHDQIVLKI